MLAPPGTGVRDVSRLLGAEPLVVRVDVARICATFFLTPHVLVKQIVLDALVLRTEAP